MPWTPKTFTELPPRIRKKIRMEPESVDERRACWVWTGSFVAPRERHFVSRTLKEGSVVTQKRVPNLHSTDLGYPTAAHRVIYGETFNISIRDVPKLKRCENDRCVSPWHCMPMGHTWRPGSPSARCLALLRAHDVSPSVSKPDAALEAGIPEHQLTDQVWQAYCIECAAESG